MKLWNEPWRNESCPSNCFLYPFSPLNKDLGSSRLEVTWRGVDRASGSQLVYPILHLHPPPPPSSSSSFLLLLLMLRAACSLQPGASHTPSVCQLITPPSLLSSFPLLTTWSFVPRLVPFTTLTFLYTAIRHDNRIFSQLHIWRLYICHQFSLKKQKKQTGIVIIAHEGCYGGTTAG